MQRGALGPELCRFVLEVQKEVDHPLVWTFPRAFLMVERLHEVESLVDDTLVCVVIASLGVGLVEQEEDDVVQIHPVHHIGRFVDA